jgi:hypothetical protein
MQYGELETSCNHSDQFEHDGSVEFDIYKTIDNDESNETEDDLEMPF